jgi:phosphatidate cytidylyltransferase
MSNNLAQRLITAAVLIPLLVVAIFALPTVYFAALLAALTAVGAWEWARLTGLPAPARAAFALLMLAVLAAAVSGALPIAARQTIAAAAMIWWLIAAAWVARFHGGTAAIPPWQGVTAGVLVLAPPLLCLAALHGEPRFGPGYVLFLLVLIWSADSGAYFAGRRFGRRKLAPRVSPGKSWEGVAGGLAAAAVAAGIGARALGLADGAWRWFLPLCLAVTAFSIIGDLLESLFKRAAGVKDSGRLLPGHGGALDRIDSLTAAAPAFYLGLSLFEWPGS